jgi:hypothetical protein
MVTRNHSDLTRLRRRAAALLWAEGLIIAIAPACAVLLCYILAALIGLGNPYLFAAVLLLSTALLAFGMIRLRGPTPAAIDRRIESASHLSHRPLADLADTPENDDQAALELWQAHQARITRSLASAKTGWPNLNAAARDKLALRALLMLGLMAGAVIAGTTGASRISNAFDLPPWPWAGPRITAWITPPSYTGAPPHILNPGESYTTLPGAKLTVLTDGPTTAPAIRIGGDPVSVTALSDTSHRADATITHSAALTIGPWWHRLARWNIQITPPAAPSIRVIEATILHSNIIKLRWHDADPYGLASVTLSFSPTGHPNALSLTFPLTTRTGDNAILVDVTRSPFSGAPVSLKIAATNIAGATASDSPAQSFTVPGLQLHDKTAAALIANRRVIASDPATAQSVATTLKNISNAPPSAITDAADIQIAGLAATIRLGQTTVPDVVNRLLALAMECEAGPDYNASRHLADSNNALTRALAEGLNGHPPTAAALAKLLAAMHAAADAHIAALQSAAGQPSGPGQQIDLSSLDKLAKQIAADEAAGNLQKAAQELQQLQQTLAALQNAQPMTAAELAQAKAAAAAAQSIAQMTQQQANLLDETNAGTATPQNQSTLQQQLQSTKAALAAAGLQIPGLAQAGNAMQTATAALTNHASQSAATAETTAIKNLQTAAAALAQAAKRQLAINPGDQPGDQTSSDGISGMPDEQPNPNFNFNPNHPNPAAAIQQQIIKQDSQPALPTATHEYYHKLLDQSP